MELENIDFGALEKITSNVSVGDGGYSTVHKGVHNGKMIAVKLLREGVYNEKIEKLFENEIKILSRVEHPNVVRLIGTCNVSRKKHIEHKGRSCFVEDSYRALCFEYMEGGDLDKHLYEESRGHDWLTRYKIIRGICDGLDSLHGGCGVPIFHLDLKPANILLDRFGIPRIADFGLSTLSTETDTYTKETQRGTVGYMPPEAYLEHPQVTEKYDVYSLGVIIIQIIAGRSGRLELSKTSPSYFVERVVANWRNRAETTEADIAQVKICISLAISCMDAEMNNRPTAAQVVDILDKRITLRLPQQDATSTVMPAPTAPPPTVVSAGEPSISVFAGYPWERDMVELELKGSSTPPQKPSFAQVKNMAIRCNERGMMRPSERRKKEEESGQRWTHKRSYDGKTDILPRISRK